MKILTAILLSLATSSAWAAESPIGEAIQKDGMQIGAVYLQSVVMHPNMPGMGANTDIHLEADIHALKGNKQGFGVGEWIPYLQIAFHMTKVAPASKWEATGYLLPMVANDGPHYGVNLKLDGPGKYHVSYHINPPSYNGFLRHADMETGVNSWWDPIDVSWDFTYTGTGKKGGY